MTGSWIVNRMDDQLLSWAGTSDQRSIFLTCYRMMTQNMEVALAQAEFIDSNWVERLLERFADYYFIALQAYEENPDSAPEVWQIAHSISKKPKAWVLQKLLLGVNAHINYDLVLTLTELLEPEWERLSTAQQTERYQDYTHVNDIIGRTIDAVQAEIIEPSMPWMDLFDRLLGRGDERLVSSLLNQWREQVWRYSMDLLQTTPLEERNHIMHRVEANSLKHAHLILLTDVPTWFEKPG